MPTARLPIDAAHRAASSDAHAIGAVTGLTDALATKVSESAYAPGRDVVSGWGCDIIQTDLGHGFLAYDPSSGNMVANLARTAGGRTIGTSADSGATWTALSAPSAVNSTGNLWFTASGTWFAGVNDGTLCRSTDSGATWSPVLTVGGGFLGQGFAEESDGTLWVAEYLNDARVWRSTDDGVTWTQVYDFENVSGSDGTVIDHVHGIAALTSGVWVFTGDSGTKCGLWLWDGSTFVRQSPALTEALGAQRYRAVGLAERDGWLYWIQDGASDAGGGVLPAIVKADPSDLAGTLTVLADLPIGGWFIKSLSTGEFVIGGVIEEVGIEQDRSCRLWVVDNDDAVHEVWSTERVSTGALAYTAVRNLCVHPTTDEVAFTINETDWTGVGADTYATVVLRVAAGKRPVHMTRVTAPKSFPTTSRAFRSSATTSSPSTTSATLVLIPEMTLSISCRSTRPWLIALSMDMKIGTAGQTATVYITATNNETGAARTIAIGTYGATTNAPFNMVALWSPTEIGPGSYTIQAKWLTTSGATVTSAYTQRRLIAVEL